MIRIIPLILLSSLLISCASITPTVNRPESLNGIQTAYVIRHEQSTRNIDIKIQKVLTERNITATVGSRNAKPNDVDVYFEYVDRWQWDITMYLVTLDLRMYDNETNELIAQSSYKNSALHGYPLPGATVRKLIRSMYGESW